jgi:hypothetical protein
MLFHLYKRRILMAILSHSFTLNRICIYVSKKLVRIYNKQMIIPQVLTFNLYLNFCASRRSGSEIN